jgi:hypothetical protein
MTSASHLRDYFKEIKPEYGSFSIKLNLNLFVM